MSNHIEAVVLPCPGVRAAAVQNSDGTFTFYINARLSEEDREEAVGMLERRIGNGQ